MTFNLLDSFPDWKVEGADVLDMSGDGFTVFGFSPQAANSTYDAIRVNVAYDPAHPTPILRQVLLNYVPITYCESYDL